MDNERLIRILTKKLRGKYNLPHWPLRLDVENAVNEALQQTDELDNLLILFAVTEPHGPVTQLDQEIIQFVRLL